MSKTFFFILFLLSGCKMGTLSTDEKTSVTATHALPAKNDQPIDSAQTCNDRLVSLIRTSSFNPEVKKFKFKVWVDESSNGVAILKITMHNTERDEDLVISWLKLDAVKKKLSDITIDPDKPVELKYDAALFKKVTEDCVF